MYHNYIYQLITSNNQFEPPEKKTKKIFQQKPNNETSSSLTNMMGYDGVSSGYSSSTITRPATNVLTSSLVGDPMFEQSPIISTTLADHTTHPNMISIGGPSYEFSAPDMVWKNNQPATQHPLTDDQMNPPMPLSTNQIPPSINQMSRLMNVDQSDTGLPDSLHSYPNHPSNQGFFRPASYLTASEQFEQLVEQMATGSANVIDINGQSSVAPFHANCAANKSNPFFFDQSNQSNQKTATHKEQPGTQTDQRSQHKTYLSPEEAVSL